jgi:hypothetical protein
MTTVLFGQRLYDWDGPGSAGVVTDTHFIRCFWPRLTEPTRIFAEGSSGLVVQGPPTPRNVIFPDDTVFPEVVADADSAAVEAATKASNGSRHGLVNATPEMVQAYLSTYASTIAKLPPTATKVRCRDDCHCLVHKELVSLPEEQPVFEVYVAEITKGEAVDLCDGKLTVEELNAEKVYVKVAESPLDPGTKVYKLEDGELAETTKPVVMEPVVEVIK